MNTVPITAVAATIYYGRQEAAPGEIIVVPEAHAATLEEAGHGHRDAQVAAKLVADRRANAAAEAEKQREADEEVRQAQFDREAKRREQAAIERAKLVGAVKAGPPPAQAAAKPSPDVAAKA